MTSNVANCRRDTESKTSPRHSRSPRGGSWEKKNFDGFLSLWLRNFHFHPRRAGKQNFTQVLPWANNCSLPRVSQFIEIPTLFCPNGLNDGLQNFFIGQWTWSILFLHFFTKKWHLHKNISEGATACLFHLPLRALVGTNTELKARAGSIFNS